MLIFACSTQIANAGNIEILHKNLNRIAEAQDALQVNWVLVNRNHASVSPLPNHYYWVNVWRKANRAIQRLVPHRAGWLCIHRYEGSWQDPNPPYYGGLQMDLGFQRAYGSTLLRSKGTAEHWTPLEQMVVAETAYQSGRGYYPWPNTARYCGLI